MEQAKLTETTDELSQIALRKNDKVSWFKSAKFGIMIHWGLYSAFAGEYHGKTIPFLGEWIASLAEIPMDEYRQAAKTFNPTNYNADEWVTLVKKAGAKYITITTKHHEGFAMYHSKASTFNIYDATPFKRDPLKELSESCEKHGIKLCFYYSHVIDFNHQDAFRNDWAYPNREKRTFENYFNEICYPQIKEILSYYGKISALWFDMPTGITKEQCDSLKSLVYNLQPDCVIGGRLGFGGEDLVTMGDNEIPEDVNLFPWETVATINNTWGYKKADNNWKTTEQLLRLLVGIVSKGGNYTLNLGPTDKGKIPNPCPQRLREIGEWLDENGESIYYTTPNPFSYKLEWGTVTQRNNKLYLHVFDKPTPFALYSIKETPQRAYWLDNKKSVPFTKDKIGSVDILTIDAEDRAFCKPISVLVLEFEKAPTIISNMIMQSPSGAIYLYPSKGQIVSKNPPELRIDHRGVVTSWKNVDESISWDFFVIEPKKYHISIYSMSQKYNGVWEGGHRYRICCNNKEETFDILDSERVVPKDLYYYENIKSNAFDITFETAGVYNLTLLPENIIFDQELGLTLARIEITPIN